MGIADLTEERKAYIIGHPSGDSSMRFLSRVRDREGTHGIDPAAFDGLDPESRAKDWGTKVGTLVTLCGMGPLVLVGLLPAYASPTCPACRASGGGRGGAMAPGG